MIDPVWWALGGGVAGAIAGSFLGVVVTRWPKGEGIGGRSACEACGAGLRWWELVPLLSYIFQRGKCRRCGAAIPAELFAIELSTSILGAISCFAFPSVEGVAGALFGWTLLGLACLDVQHFWLPDRLTATLAALGLARAVGGIPPYLSDSLIGGAAGFGVLGLVALTYRKIRGREGMGAGDPKLFGAIGLWVGWQALPFVLLGASAVGLVAVLLMRLRGEAVAADTRLPFGALMAVAAFPVWLLMR